MKFPHFILPNIIYRAAPALGPAAPCMPHGPQFFLPVKKLYRNVPTPAAAAASHHPDGRLQCSIKLLGSAHMWQAPSAEMVLACQL